MKTKPFIESQLWEQSRPITHLHAFYHWEKVKPQAIYMRQPYGNRWHPVTWQEAGNQARRIATALKDLSVQKGTLVGLIS